MDFINPHHQPKRPGEGVRPRSTGGPPLQADGGKPDGHPPDGAGHADHATRLTIQVTKADGSDQRFDKSKLALSLKAAGASEAVAHDVATRVEGELRVAPASVTTREVRAMAMDLLARRAPEAAYIYEATRRLVARRAIEATEGVARLPPAVMASMRVRNGSALRITGRASTRTMDVEVNERTAILGGEIRLSSADMRSLGVRDGDRILVRRASNGSQEEGRVE